MGKTPAPGMFGSFVNAVNGANDSGAHDEPPSVE
jgi:hypothetical protein